ncbi:penicillin-binding protein 1C [Leptospira interrogans]|nr:penicillin-binding protein 1C [Leptospira interrogans]AKP26002.1 penicillin-binding protein [Leptospira interrogans serovar Manilae]AKP29787.1 penicillin-binding protein [Leptospira interrogans serovar Manilae]EYU64437.1 penicillin-binding protein [Leptospira interrogans serovar Manilae]
MPKVIRLILWLLSIFLYTNLLFSEEEKNKEIPSYKEIRNSYRPSDGVILDHHGRILQTIRWNVRERKLSWTEEGEIPETFLLALFLQEDKRFFEHSGVDRIAILGSIKDRLFGSSRRGASTLSMQLAGIFLGTKPGQRNIFDKWEQMQTAQKIEKTWTKNEILTAYLNLTQFRGELRGLRAASRGLFQKEPSTLSDTESILLVAMLPYPGASYKVLAKRSCILAKKIQKEELCDYFESVAKKATSKINNLPSTEGIAYHVALKIFRENPEIFSIDGKIKTTIDFDLQWKITEIAKNNLYGLKKQNVSETGILVLDNISGAVLAYIGNLEDSNSFYVDAIQSKRQAGSTLKPFLYGLAFEKEILKPNSILEDSPAEWNAVSGIYKPSNYSDTYHGNVQAKYALASSLNIPAIRVLDLVNVPDFVEKLKELGLNGLKRADFYGSSLALGTADVTLFELTNAYRTLANGGISSKPTFFPFEAKRTVQENFKEGNFWNRVYTKKSADTLSEILSDREYRSLSFGLNNYLSTRFFTAVKTGTSQDMRDNWCIGYSKKYTVGVWVGNMNGKPMWDVSGVTGAAPIWNTVINLLQEREEQPNNLTLKNSYIPPARQLTELSKIPKILIPGNETIYALDPDIPEGRQKLHFYASQFDSGFKWILDGKSIQEAKEKEVFWKPEKGFHILSLQDQNGKIIDSVVFEVR